VFLQVTNLPSTQQLVQSLCRLSQLSHPYPVFRHHKTGTGNLLITWLLLCGGAYRVNQTGVAVQQFVTTSPKLFDPYKDEDIHGGPPLIHVPAHLSGLGRDYFLGIFHFFNVGGD
jgi:hypothetical protein